MVSVAVRVTRLALATVVVIANACAPEQPAPVASALRGHEFVLRRVDGRLVRGTQAVAVRSGSREERTGCRDRVSDGTLLISPSGRSFTYRSVMRDCGGNVLSTETNEGLVGQRDSLLAFVIEGNSGPATFYASFSDSTVTIRDLGGLLEFTRR
jgi:hypothetical protein